MSQSISIRRLNTARSVPSLFVKLDPIQELETTDSYILSRTHFDKKQLKKARHEVSKRLELLKAKKNNFDRIQGIAEHEKLVKINTNEANIRFNEYLKLRQKQEIERRAQDAEYRIKTMQEKQEKDYLGLMKRVAEEKVCIL